MIYAQHKLYVMEMNRFAIIANELGYEDISEIARRRALQFKFSLEVMKTVEPKVRELMGYNELDTLVKEIVSKHGPMPAHKIRQRIDGMYDFDDLKKVLKQFDHNNGNGMARVYSKVSRVS